MGSRRRFIEQSAASIMGAALPRSTIFGATDPASTLIDVLRPPDQVTVRLTSADLPLNRAPGSTEEWDGPGVTVRTRPGTGALAVELSAPATGVVRVGLRWRRSLRSVQLLLGDAWERAYGDLEWRGFVPDRVMPWYVITWDGRRTNGYGVRTGANAFCAWQADSGGLSLWADVQSGGVPVQLGARSLQVCEVVARAGHLGESPFAALHAFCRQMCPAPRLPPEPVYGSNDWYWAYGNNSAATVLADAERIVALSPTGTNRPWVVIDDGWQPGRGAERTGAGNWDHGNEKFPDIAAVAARVSEIGARPGIWIRPLQAPSDAPDGWRLPRDRATLDPTVPEVTQRIGAEIRRLQGWGMRLIKHDYTTYDLLGRWGNQMVAGMTRGGWTHAEGPRRTSAEVINGLYDALRQAADGALLLGCNTVSHLSAGRFDLCRIGDDTSGTEWSRTRRMGVNTLAFRGAQHGAFYSADADCVGVTNAIPWELNRQWLDLLARSGTTLFVSLAPDAVGSSQQQDLRAALRVAARAEPLGEPVDWQHTTWPARWRLMGADHRYDWGEPG